MGVCEVVSMCRHGYDISGTLWPRTSRHNTYRGYVSTIPQPETCIVYILCVFPGNSWCMNIHTLKFTHSIEVQGYIGSDENKLNYYLDGSLLLSCRLYHTIQYTFPPPNDKARMGYWRKIP